MSASRLACFTFALVALTALPALAQSGAAGTGDPSGSGVRTVASDHELEDEMATIEDDRRSDRDDEDEELPPDDGVNPRELADHDYYFAGIFMRGVAIPDFMQGLFVHYEGGTPVNGGGGAYFGWRRNGFNVRAEVWYLGFGNVGYYRGLNAVDTELERVQSDLGVVFGSFTFGWTFWVNEYFGIDLGFGLGLGGVTGNMWREEAYRTGPAGPGGTPHECARPGDPADTAGYCETTPVEDRHTNHDADGGTYQRYCGANPPAGSPGHDAYCTGGSGRPSAFYFGDGGTPPLFFWMDLPRLGVTIKPIRQFEIRLDGGYNLYGFNFGAAMGVGF